jgi:uncharacterized protein YukJ|tara:strand:- start:616 stop:801 length:186 start_codon:yes stop_codon:yes gene_type:complete
MSFTHLIIFNPLHDEEAVQDKNNELTYKRDSDFTDEVANEFRNQQYSINKSLLTNYPQLLK